MYSSQDADQARIGDSHFPQSDNIDLLQYLYACRLLLTSGIKNGTQNAEHRKRTAVRAVLRDKFIGVLKYETAKLKYVSRK